MMLIVSNKWGLYYLNVFFLSFAQCIYCNYFARDWRAVKSHFCTANLGWNGINFTHEGTLRGEGGRGGRSNPAQDCPLIPSTFSSLPINIALHMSSFVLFPISSLSSSPAIYFHSVFLPTSPSTSLRSLLSVIHLPSLSLLFLSQLLPFIFFPIPIFPLLLVDHSSHLASNFPFSLSSPLYISFPYSQSLPLVPFFLSPIFPLIFFHNSFPFTSLLSSLFYIIPSISPLLLSSLFCTYLLFYIFHLLYL